MARPPLDPDVETQINMVGAFAQLTAENLQGFRADSARLDTPASVLTESGAISVEERFVPGPGGAPEVGLVILSPTGWVGPRPALFLVHGGGMVMGSSWGGLEGVLEWVTELGLTVVSVNYRLAPEHPDPAPIEDCYAGLQWVADNAIEIGIDPEQIIVHGGSAGGGLAAGLALLARDRGGPSLAGQFLFCPMLDDRRLTQSSRDIEPGLPWDRHSNEWAWNALLAGNAGGDDVSIYAAPARASDLTGLPPTFIDVGSADTFRDECVEYASRLSGAGVSVEFHLWPGGVHGFEGLAPHSRIARGAEAARWSWLEAMLGYERAK